MCNSLTNVTTLLIRLLVFYLIYSQQLSVSSISNANKTGKSSLNRKNDKFYRYFNKHFQQLSTPGSELRQQIERSDQKLNISLTVSDFIPPIPSNEFTDMQTASPNHYRPDLSAIRRPNKECQCSCDPYQKANQLINEYVMTDNEDTSVDDDDNDELEKLQRPYKYIPMETIELAHQRPQRVTTTPGPPTQHKLTNYLQSVSQYIRFPKFSTTEALELGLSLAITGLLGAMGLTSLSPYHTIFRDYRRTSALNDRNYGYYQNYYTTRQLNDTDDLANMVYHWIQSLIYK